MTIQAAALARDDRACPWLGLANDPDRRVAYPSEQNRCHSREVPIRVDLTMQTRACLTERHIRCSRYVEPDWVADPVPAEAGFAEDERLPREYESWPTARTPRGTAPAARPAAAVASPRTMPRMAWLPQRPASRIIALGVVLLYLSFFGLVSTQLARSELLARLGPTPSASLSATPVATTPVASPSPTAAPSPTAVPAPTPFAYVVHSGDTLSGIASRFGTTVDAIMSANGLTSRNYIITGQRLVIPTP